MKEREENKNEVLKRKRKREKRIVKKKERK